MHSQNSWSIEYSHSQGTFHVGRTTDMLRRNIHSLGNGQTLDYICVGIYSSREQALNAILEFRRNSIPGYSMALQI